MLNVVTLFSGYDSQCLALNRLGVDYNLAAWCEIDRHAITAHNALFPQWKDRNLGDVSRVDWEEWHRRHPERIDLLTYSSPCQDFSSAGLQRGGEEGSGTRSGLLWETERAVRELRPRHLVFENVGGLVSDKFISLFNRWQARLNGYGYTNFQQLMNAKDYGVPQNRLRIFMVSILDCPRAYYFPQPFRLERRLKDVLEQNVAERYYLKEEQVERLMIKTEEEQQAGHGYKFEPLTGDEDYGRCVTTNSGGRMTDNFISEPEIQQIGNLHNNEGNPQSGRVYSSDGVSPTVDASAPEHNRRVLIAESQMIGWARNEKGEITDRHPVSVANCVTAAKRDNIQNYVMEPTIIEDFYGTVRDPRLYTDEAPTLRAGRSGLMVTKGIRIRRLTERELYRLMDVDEADIDTLLAAPIPRTQHAKLAGNSIVVACPYYIFRNLFVATEPEAGTQTILF